MVDPNANRVDIGIPVLIVGAGPAGLTLALARYGVPALTVEKHPSTAHAACSHHQSAHGGDFPGSRQQRQKPRLTNPVKPD
jgi:flavin-dependent dehydrogenase